MAEQAEVSQAEVENEEIPGYKPPAEKSMEEILKADAEDESLIKYKATLLGGAEDVPFPEDPRQVIVNKLTIVVDGRPEIVIDLTGNLEVIKKQKPIVIKEGVSYKVKVYFYIQREIVTGLKYLQKVHRKGICVDKNSFMVGSYGPKMELQSYTAPAEEAPTGMLSRGTYTVKSTFTDDDKKEHLKWEWSFDIKKDWKD